LFSILLHLLSLLLHLKSSSISSSHFPSIPIYLSSSPALLCYLTSFFFLLFLPLLLVHSPSVVSSPIPSVSIPSSSISASSTFYFIPNPPSSICSPSPHFFLC
jgi:hypothetical protein